MAFLRLAVCVAGVSITFILWAIAQERLSAPFPARSAGIPPSAIDDGYYGDRFPSPIFLNFCQAIFSSLSAFLYLVFSAWRDGSLTTRTFGSITGWTQIRATAETSKPQTSHKSPNKTKVVRANGHAHPEATEFIKHPSGLARLLFQISLFQTSSGPIGFISLRHISYPTMVLGKSCKLIPVLLLNILLYRRRFSAHKYVVVALVTAGIGMFTFFGPRTKRAGQDSVWGSALLIFSLLLDGLTNSTQDQVFASFPRFTGQQMMFAIAVTTQIILLPFLILPLPSHPWSILEHLTSLSPVHIPFALSPPAFLESLRFLNSHPSAIGPLLAYSVLGGIGQLFIFETIQHFGSLTLVMVTVTRKLFTMLLSVVVFRHHLTAGQWMGMGVVFSGIGLEAVIKRRDVLRRARRDKVS